MNHAKVDASDKSHILQSFQKPKSSCRVCFSTIAFGIGVDISDICFVIHYGPAADIDDNFQECGRGGRDGYQSYFAMQDVHLGM